MYRSVVITFLSLFVLGIVPFGAHAQEITAEELVSKHQMAVGFKGKLENAKNLLLVGDASFKAKGHSTILGKALILSENNKVLWGMNFASNDYPQDRFAFDGKKLRMTRTAPAGRSLLTRFLLDNSELVEKGMFSGPLSKTWSLFNLDGRAKLKVAGRKKIDGKDSIVLEYSLKGGSDVDTKYYFDSESYQLIRAEHTVLRAATQGPTVDSSAGQSGTVYRLTEDFSQFKKMGDFTLPSSYRISYSQSGGQSISTPSQTAREAEWSIDITDFAVNQAVDESSFSVDK